MPTADRLGRYVRRYNKDQPRDEHGRFASSDGATEKWDGPRLYHGTPRAFSVGDHIKSAAEAGVVGHSGGAAHMTGAFATSGITLAESFSHGGDQQHIYEVVPVTPSDVTKNIQSHGGVADEYASSSGFKVVAEVQPPADGWSKKWLESDDSHRTRLFQAQKAHEGRSAVLGRHTRRYNEDQPRGADGRFGSGDTINPLEGQLYGKAGNPTTGIHGGADQATVPPAKWGPATDGNKPPTVLGTLATIGGVTQAQATQNTVDSYNRALDAHAAGTVYDKETGRTAVEAGTVWYGEAQQFAAGNGPEVATTLNGEPSTVNADIRSAGFDHPTMVGITAALSPQQSWPANMTGAAAIANFYATDPSTPLTAEQAATLNEYHSGSLGQYQNADGTKWTGTDQQKANPEKFGATWVPVGTPPFQFTAGMTYGDIRAGVGLPEGVPKVAAAAVAVVGMYNGVSAGGSGYGNIEKGIRIANGESPNDVLGGAKVRSFYNNIGTGGTTKDVTIDSHMAQAMVNVGGKTGADNMKSVSDHMTNFMGTPSSGGANMGAYPALADAVRTATDQINATRKEQGEAPLTPSQVQAIVWCQQISEYPPKQSAQSATLRPMGVAHE